MPIKKDNNQPKSRLFGRIFLYVTGGLLLLNLAAPAFLGSGIQRVPYSLFIHQVDGVIHCYAEHDWGKHGITNL